MTVRPRLPCDLHDSLRLQLRPPALTGNLGVVSTSRECRRQYTRNQAVVAQASATAGAARSNSAVDLEEISGQRLYVEFKALGFYERTCQVELRSNGDCVFSKGMVTEGPGAWRVEASDSAG